MEKKSISGWHDFLDLCFAAHDQKALGSLFDFFFTANEKENLAMRFLLIKELLLGEKTQRLIAQDLNISIAKITRGSNELKRIDPKLLKLLREKFHK